MDRLVEIMKARAEQFTPMEIEAEILRQQIRDEEMEGPKGGAQVSYDLRLDRLRRRLAELEEAADLNSQGRNLLRQYAKMMAESRDMDSLPPGTEELMAKYCNWLDAMRKEVDKQHIRDMEWLNIRWRTAQWPHHLDIAKLFGRHLTRRYIIDKPRYYAGSVLLGWIRRWARKG